MSRVRQGLLAFYWRGDVLFVGKDVGPREIELLMMMKPKLKKLGWMSQLLPCTRRFHFSVN